MINKLEALIGDEYRTDICKIRVSDKGYLLQGDIVGVKGRILTIKIPTFYRDAVRIVDVNINDIVKIKKSRRV